MSQLKVIEIFRSVQGEGANVGKQVVFVRLSDCNLNCWFCDTDWERGQVMDVQDVLTEVEKLHCKFLIWTGGEPTMQLTEEIVQLFKARGYYQAIETNGTNPVPEGIDYISCSLKAGIDLIQKNFKDRLVGEYRYPYGVGEKEPPAIDDLPPAMNYCLSPLFLGESKKRPKISPENVKACLDYINKDNRWRLSIQTHKLLNIR